MAFLVWCAGLALAALLIAALRGGRPEPVDRWWLNPALAMATARPAAVEPPRPSPRPALQTSAALLAIALALDAGALSPPAAAAPLQPDAVWTAPADPAFLTPPAPVTWTPTEPATDWSFRALGASEGWVM